MADVWEGSEGIPTETWTQMQAARARLYQLVQQTPWLVWLFLSKRPENAPELCPREWFQGAWPSNVWAGATMENQEETDRRWPALARLPAPRHFASYEPAMEAVDFSAALRGVEVARIATLPADYPASEPATAHPERRRLDWIIVGGESGAKARTFDAEWARSVIRQCRAAGASPFVKQLGACAVDAVNGIAGRDTPVPAEVKLYRRLKDGHGADLAEWAPDLRVQERPAPLPVAA
jgi:protein gp37